MCCLSARGKMSARKPSYEELEAKLEKAEAIIADYESTKEAHVQSEAKFRELVEASGDWTWETNDKGVCTYVSPQIETILGYKPEEVLGKTPFDFMDPKEAEKKTKAFESLARRSAKPTC